jgi:hypothetical protein
VLKELYPEPITLRTQIVLRGKAIWLGNDSYITDLYQVLANWVGPRYRMGPRTNIKLHYYNREVYGRSLKYNHQDREWRSNARHLDHHWVQHRYDENYRPDRVSPNPLPNPFDKGDAWNAEPSLLWKQASPNSSLRRIGSNSGCASMCSTTIKSISTDSRINTLGTVV